MNIAIAGCTGRMGLTLVKATLAASGLTLVAGSERAGYDPQVVGVQLATVGVHGLFITSDPHTLADKADAVIDFTTPEATLPLARAIAAKGGIHIIGTTGFTAAQQQEIERLAANARIVMSGNFSLGVNVLEALVEKTAKLLNDSYDIEIYEMHHKHKKDAPSGTALMLGRAAAKGRNVSFEEKKTIDRDNVRKTGDIGFAVARGGDVVGVHDVMFAGPGELITLSHQGFSREIYANGALKAAAWAQSQQPGLYSLRDML